MSELLQYPRILSHPQFKQTLVEIMIVSIPNASTRLQHVQTDPTKIFHKEVKQTPFDGYNFQELSTSCCENQNHQLVNRTKKSTVSDLPAFVCSSSWSYQNRKASTCSKLKVIQSFTQNWSTTIQSLRFLKPFPEWFNLAKCCPFTGCCQVLPCHWTSSHSSPTHRTLTSGCIPSQPQQLVADKHKIGVGQVMVE